MEIFGGYTCFPSINLRLVLKNFRLASLAVSFLLPFVVDTYGLSIVRYLASTQVLWPNGQVKAMNLCFASPVSGGLWVRFL